MIYYILLTIIGIYGKAVGGGHEAQPPCSRHAFPRFLSVQLSSSTERNIRCTTEHTIRVSQNRTFVLREEIDLYSAFAVLRCIECGCAL